MKIFSKKTQTNPDEERLKKFIELCDEGIDVTTGFIQDPETGNITHQIIKVQSGEFISYSQPEQLEVVLRIATPEEQGQLVN